jgi:hypothetical protein
VKDVTPEMSNKDENPNIQVEITDASTFHCFRLTLNPKSSPGERIEIMFHARSLVDLIHKCSLALCEWQAQQSDYLLQKLTLLGSEKAVIVDGEALEALQRKAGLKL